MTTPTTAAPSASIDLEDDGFVPVTLRDPGTGKPITLSVDLYRTFCRLIELPRKDASGNLSDLIYLQGVVDLLKELGFPPVSHHLAGRFASKVMELGDALKKKAATMPASPDSTESTPTKSPVEPEPASSST